MSKVPWDQVISLSGLDVAKLILSAFVILFVTKVQLFHDRLSALLIALPLISLLAMLRVVDNGHQCAILAPTEVLAAQHYRTMTSMLGYRAVTARAPSLGRSGATAG